MDPLWFVRFEIRKANTPCNSSFMKFSLNFWNSPSHPAENAHGAAVIVERTVRQPPLGELWFHCRDQQNKRDGVTLELSWSLEDAPLLLRGLLSLKSCSIAFVSPDPALISFTDPISKRGLLVQLTQVSCCCVLWTSPIRQDTGACRDSRVSHLHCQLGSPGYGV